MPAKSRSTARAWRDPDDAPDLSKPKWAKKIEAAPVKRGRPKSAAPKVSTTIRLDRKTLEAFKAGGQGWQTRMAAALDRAAAKQRRAG